MDRDNPTTWPEGATVQWQPSGMIATLLKVWRGFAWISWGQEGQTPLTVLAANLIFLSYPSKSRATAESPGRLPGH